MKKSNKSTKRNDDVTNARAVTAFLVLLLSLGILLLFMSYQKNIIGSGSITNFVLLTSLALALLSCLLYLINPAKRKGK